MIQRLYQELWKASCYRGHPVRAIKFLRAKYRFARSRARQPEDVLRGLGIDPADALRDFEKWRPLVTATVERVTRTPGGQGGISMDDGVVLYCVVRCLRPERVVETGVSAGVSTTFLSAALIDNESGHLHSIELPPNAVRDSRQADGAEFDWPLRGAGWAVPDAVRSGIGQRWTLILQDVRLALPALLSELGRIDVFLHDDLHDPDHMFWEYQLVWNRLNTGGALISDDVNDGWLRFCDDRKLGPSAMRNMQRLAAVRKHPDEDRDL